MRRFGRERNVDAGQSTRAAHIYLHSSAERQRAIADQIGKNATTMLGRQRNQSGTYVARNLTGES